MKKLLVAAIGAAAAIGAFADYTNAVRLEGSGETISELNAAAVKWTKTEGTYFAAPASSNQYAITSLTGTLPTARPLMSGVFEDDPETELSVKTQFGKPLEFYVDPSNTSTGKSIGNGLYFDSLVKFTVCDDDPVQEYYSDAKIVMWLQEATNSLGNVVATNIIVKAGYLSKDGSVTATPTTYVCGNNIPGDFADAWHRVTIKAINDITAAEAGVPGFAIYIDGGNSVAVKEVAASGAKWDQSFDYELTEAAQYLSTDGKLFPSLKQGSTGNKQTLTGVAFDGTGSLNDLVVTDIAPDFAQDHAANKATVVIGGVTNVFESIEEAIDEINDAQYSGATASLSLMKSLALTEPIVFTGAGATTIELDFAGFVLTNELDMAAITNSAVTLIVTNSSVGVGGIYCSDANGGAIATVCGATTINDGWFYGNITVENASLAINGGCFKQGYQALKSYLPSTKVTEVVQAMGLTFNKVVDYVPEVYTITFNTMGGAFADPTEATQEVTEGNYVQKPTDPEKSGATFVKWVWDDDDDGETPMVEFIFDSDPEERESTEVTDDYELFAEWYVVPTYTITFVYGLTGEYSVQQIGIQAGATPTLPADPETPYAVAGYNIAWPEFAAASASVTYTATYTGKTFTIYTCTNGIVNTSKEFTYAGASVAPADPTFNSETEEWDGKWYISNGSSTEFAFDPAGEATQFAYATITAKSGGNVPDIPAGGETDCGTAEAATAAAAAINADAASKAAHIKVPTGAVAETYLGYVEAVAVGTKVTVDFTTAGAAAAQTSANNDVVSEAVSAAVTAAAAAGSEGSGTASVSTVAGFYYSIVSGTSPTAVTTEGTRVLGTGGSVNLTVPNKGPAGFYKVKVSARAAD